MIRFKTLKALAEYAHAHESSIDRSSAIQTVTIAIEQGWVRISPKTRDRLNNKLELEHYVLDLLDKHCEPDLPSNVIGLFSSNKNTNSSGSKDTDYFSNLLKKNKESTDRLSEQRSNSNRSILRKYRIKK